MFKVDAIFYYARFDETIYFKSSHIYGNLKLEKSRIHTLDINLDSNISHISLKDSTITRLIVPWVFLK